jgi:transcriptional regulator with XRE-family HTH domain
MTDIYRRVREKKMELGYEWDALAAAAGIHISSWMTGLPSSNPTDEELKKLAPVLGTTFEWLKYGID